MEAGKSYPTFLPTSPLLWLLVPVPTLEVPTHGVPTHGDRMGESFFQEKTHPQGKEGWEIFIHRSHHAYYSCPS